MGDPSDTRGQYNDSRTAEPGNLNAGIDRAFAMADRGVAAIGELLGVSAPKAREQVRRAGVTMSRWRIDEVTDAHSGQPVWIVTNGLDRAECNTPEFATRVLDALNGAG
jgi:hypothetical protein